MSDCLFCKIVNKQIPAKILYEDDEVLAFPDINPQAQTHILVIPKTHISSLAKVDINNKDQQLALGRMLQVANKIAVDNGSLEGCRVIVNNGRIGNQEVMHIHMHILGGSKPIGSMVSKV